MNKKLIFSCVVAASIAGAVVIQSETRLEQVLTATGFYADGTEKWEWIWVEKVEPVILISEPVPFPGSFERRFKADGAFDIYYIAPDGRAKRVSADKPLYLQYVAEGRPVVDVPYVAPAITPLADEQIRSKVLRAITAKRDSSIEGGFTFEGRIFPTSTFGREAINAGKRLADKADKNGVGFVSKVVSATGEVVTFDKAQIAALSEAYDDYCASVYATFANEIERSQAATRADLDAYLANGGFSQ